MELCLEEEPEPEPEPEPGPEPAPQPATNLLIRAGRGAVDAPYTDALLMLKDGHALDAQAQADPAPADPKGAALDAIRCYEHGLRLLAAAEAAGVCRHGTLQALRPMMAQVDE